MKQAFFIAGTDTEVGKTYVSCALMRHFTQQNLRVAGMKPVASGCEMLNGQLINEDALHLQATANVSLPYATVNPYAFAPAIAPHIAAQQAGVEIQFEPILQAYAQIKQQTDVVIVEGAGGLLVPLNAQYNIADLVKELDIPIILVVGIKLGCINHAQLTAEAIRARGLKLVGWVANQITPGMLHISENIATIQSSIQTPCFAEISWKAQAITFKELL